MLLTKFLAHCNFGDFYKSAIKVLYTDIMNCVLNNGSISEWFQLSRSCRQGCPISAKIFNLITEPLADQIRQNPNIKGIIIEGKEIKGVQYADDLWLSLLANDDNIGAAMAEMKRFYLFSGLKINYDKTNVLKIGHWPDGRRIMVADNLNWSLDSIKVLGILINPDRDIMIEQNYSSLLQKMRDRILMWRYRTLTRYGKSAGD